MRLNLYRRHGSHCLGNLPLHAMTYQADEQRRSWKSCACPIYASGTMAGVFRRKNTECNTWEEAKALARSWEDAASWDGPTPAPQVTAATTPAPSPAITVTDGRISIERAVNAFTAEFREHAAPNTQKKYSLLLKKLKAFSAKRGFVMLDQWGPIDVREFRSSWTVSPQTAAKNMSTVKAFFEFCLSNEWVSRNPARLVKNPRGRDAADRRNEQKLPFTDAELAKMYDACEKKYGKQQVKRSRTIHHRAAQGEYARYNYKWTGQDLADFTMIELRNTPAVEPHLSVNEVAELRGFSPNTVRREFQHEADVLRLLRPAPQPASDARGS